LGTSVPGSDLPTFRAHHLRHRASGTILPGTPDAGTTVGHHGIRHAASNRELGGLFG
jgi:hypothetical protein